MSGDKTQLCLYRRSGCELCFSPVAHSASSLRQLWVRHAASPFRARGRFLAFPPPLAHVRFPGRCSVLTASGSPRVGSLAAPLRKCPGDGQVSARFDFCPLSRSEGAGRIGLYSGPSRFARHQLPSPVSPAGKRHRAILFNGFPPLFMLPKNLLLAVLPPVEFLVSTFPF